MIMKKKEIQPLKLDLSFAAIPVTEGYTRATYSRDGVCLDNKLLAKESVSEIISQHLLQRLDGGQRMTFMDELYRVLVPGGKVTVIVPYWSSPLAVQDPTHMWPPIVDQSFLYFNKNWREANGCKDYPVKCDFDFSGGYVYETETAQRSEEVRPFWSKHYLNAVTLIQIVLVKK